MIRIQFTSDEDRIRGNYLLATNSVVRRLRGHIFEIAERDRKLLDEHQLHYTLVSIPDPTGTDDEILKSSYR
jgi:hypothetical protein